MNVAVSLKPISDWTEGELETLEDLSRAVHPPEVTAQWTGRHLEWTDPEWGVRVFGNNSELVSFTGIVLRQAQHDGRTVRIGGIGGVKTHPTARRRGYAAMAVRRAVEFFVERPDVEFAVLVCEPRLIEYYSRLGWNEFTGRLLTTQHGEAAEFTFNRVMVIDVHSTAPRIGTIDLLGPPW